MRKGGRPGTPPVADALPGAPPNRVPDLAVPGRGRQMLIYTPDGPVGGTFTCVACAAQAWQPDLLDHAAACPYRAVQRRTV